MDSTRLFGTFLYLFCALLMVTEAIPLAPLDELNCGYKSCHPVSQDQLNVHLVPHSHDDVGWLKTVDQYYYGSASKYQFAGVQYIIGSVVEALKANPERRFIQVETAYFWRWWQKQSETTKASVRQLINSGRLEIINGAWSMNDEAAAHYHSIIDQFTWGLRIINDTLGECGRPKIGWQIDPFGHSREMASIFAQLGYEAMFFARLDYRDNKLRHSTKNLETIWQGSQSLGNKSDLFTGVLYDFYTTPAHFCWDVLCSDVPIIDDPESPDYNEDQIVANFADYVVKGAAYYKTNHLLVTMGGDFTYQAAEMFYNNMDKLITGFKKFRPNITVIYSTPSCYLKAVNKAAMLHNVNFTRKTDDFFPYASGNHSYWTGYFTSRPNSKRFERQGNNLLQVSKQLTTLATSFNKSADASLTLLKEVMGIMQHHDAITGTEKQHVADDYVRLLDKAMKKAESGLGDIIHVLLGKDGKPIDKNGVSLSTCLLANVSRCDASNSDEFVVAVYNPLSRRVIHYVQLPVNGTSYNVTFASSNIDYDLMPSIMTNFTSDTGNASKYNLIFPAKVPALGVAYFHVKKLNETKNLTFGDEKEEPNEIHSYGNDNFSFSLDSKGFLSAVTMHGVTLSVKQEFLFYRGSNGTNFGEEKRASGAYIFRPVNNTRAVKISEEGVKIVAAKAGNNVIEVHQVFNPWIKQIIRAYIADEVLEFDWIVGPINLIRSYEGMEIISRFTSNDLNSEGTFFTDSNGREMIRRVRNWRETYNYTNEEPVSGNYYPVTSRITIRDPKRGVELGVLNDRAQGGSSLADGEVELMVHRRLVNDDAFGVGEALRDMFITRGQHYLVVSKIKDEDNNSAKLQRMLAQERLLSPWTLVGKVNSTSGETKNLLESLEATYSALNQDMPENVQILTLEPWKDGSILLRLEHIMEVNEHPQLSKPVTVNLKKVFRALPIKSCRETTLGGNQWIEENEKLHWDVTNKYQTEKVPLDLTKITLNPMEIRTLVCQP